VCLAVLPAIAASNDELTRILKGVQDRYNHAKTLQVSFNETYTVQGRPRQTESGTLTLRKPGRMRWDYSTPAGKLFVSDGKDVFLYTPEGKRVEKMKLKESEDMRAPLAFLLGKLDFLKEFRDFDMKPEGTGFVITAKAKSDKLPYELDEAATIDGASALQVFRMVYLPLMTPSLVAVGTYALILAWNEYLYAFLLLSRDTTLPLSVALGNFLAADDTPWELLMATGLLYALPPAAIYYVFRRYMVAGLTAGAVKS